MEWQAMAVSISDDVLYLRDVSTKRHTSSPPHVVAQQALRLALTAHNFPEGLAVGVLGKVEASCSRSRRPCEHPLLEVSSLQSERLGVVV